MFNIEKNTSVQSIVHVFDYNRINKDVRLVIDVPDADPIKSSWSKDCPKKAIIFLSYTDLAKSRHIINQLAEFLRGSFDFTNTERLALFSQELKWVKAYIEIEQARFKDR